jgi:tetratricopeptide (TPR) repeat protein
VLASVAWFARNEAEQQRRLAVQQSLTAERTADFLISLFKVSDPGEARGNSVTAREILDKGALQINQSLVNEPQVRAKLSATLGEVYRGLGLYDSAASLLSSARAVSGQRPLDWIQQSYQLGELEFQRGNYVEADRLYAAAEQRYAGSAANDPATEANIALGRGAVAALLAQQERARDFFRRAINIGNTNRLQSVIVESLEHLAQADFQAGDFAAAERSYTSALNARIAYSGETHPRVSKSLNGLAAVAYSRGDSQRAESYWTRALATDRRLLGAKHPDLAPTLNNLGRLRLERRKFTSAIEVLAEALTIKDAQMNKTNSTMVFVLSNLALAHMGRNEFSQSEPLLDRALSVAIQNDHPLRGQLMAYQADVYCHGKRAAEGLQVLIAARSFIVQRYPDDPWRLAYAESVGAGCLTSMARYHEAAGLMQTSLSVVLAKWPADTFYGHDALERAVRLYTLSGNTAKAAEYRKLLAAK